MDVGMTGGGQSSRQIKTSDLMKELDERAKQAVEGWNDIHLAAEKDVKFALKGEQWPEDVAREREDPESPRVMLTINQLPKFLRQVIGDGKQNRLSISVVPVEGDRAMKIRNLAGNKDYSYAQIMEGLVRNIEFQSKAERAYDKALEHCADGGFGWMRVIKRYTRPDGFEQELAIRGIRNRYSVLIDPMAMLSDEPDMADMTYGIVHTKMPKFEAQKKWGKEIVDSQVVESETVTMDEWWANEEGIRVCEYYWVEEAAQAYALLSDGRVVEADQVQAIAQKAVADGKPVVVVQERKGVKRCVWWVLTDGREPLEGPYKWDGGYIPLVPVLGPEVFSDGKMEYQSLFRHAHDAQRLYNYWRTAATEAVALAPKAPWLADVQSIAGFEQDYADSQIRPKQLLKYRHREGVAPPSRVAAAFNPAAEISQALAANDDIKNTVGLFDASLGQRSNETSGVAIEARQAEGDVSTFSWHDALAKGVEQIGRILVDCIPKIYDTPRQVRLRMPDESEDWVALNEEVQGPDGQMVVADLSACRYDVAVKAGPSYTTQRNAAARGMTDFVRAVPQAGAVTADLVAEAMDWPKADKFAKRLRKTLPPGMLEPQELEELHGGQPPEPPPPSPEQLIQAKELELKDKELAIKDKELDIKSAELSAMQPQNVKDLVAEALAELLTSEAPRAPRPPAQTET